MVEFHRQIPRRKFLRVCGLLPFAFAAAACTQSQQPLPPQAAGAPAHAAPSRTEIPKRSIDPLIAVGRKMREVHFEANNGPNINHVYPKIPKIDDVWPQVDIPYSTMAEIDRIRNISNITARIMAAIGFLDVEGSPRYAENKPYVCNVYALDLSILLLGNDVIGSAYNKQTLEPWVAGPDVAGPERIQYEDTHWYFTSNNLDSWMEKKGAQLGWKKAKNQADLAKALANGAIGLAVSSQEYIDLKNKEALKKYEAAVATAKILGQDPNLVIYEGFTGHTSIVAWNPLDNKFVMSQATTNYMAQDPYLNDTRTLSETEDTVKEYSVWVHSLPEAAPTTR